MLIEKKTIIPPEGGWKAHNIYLADVAINKHNPVHRAVMLVGFLDHDGPGSYSEVRSNSYDHESYPFRMAWYVRVVRDLGPMCDGGLNYQTYKEQS